MRTIGTRWRGGKNDYAADCSVCGVPWPRSKLQLRDGLLLCPDDRKGMTVAEIDRLKLRLAQRAGRAPVVADGGLARGPYAGGAAPEPEAEAIMDPVENWGGQLLAWYRASADTCVLNGSDVSQWRDRGPNGYHVTQASASRQPAYNATGGPLSQPTVDFTVANSDVLALFVPSPKSKRLVSMFCVAAEATGAGSGTVAAIVGASVGVSSIRLTTTPDIEGRYPYTGGALEADTLLYGTAFGTAFAAYGAYTVPGRRKLAINGAVVASGTRLPFVGDLVSRITIGSNNVQTVGTAGITSFNGKVREVIFVQDEVNPLQLARHWRYVANDTGLFEAA